MAVLLLSSTFFPGFLAEYLHQEQVSVKVGVWSTALLLYCTDLYAFEATHFLTTNWFNQCVARRHVHVAPQARKGKTGG